MQEIIRKHRKLLGVLILLFIGFPMIFFGLPNFWSAPPTAGRGDEIHIGKVGDVPLQAADFDRVLRSYMRSGPDGQQKTPADLEADGTVDKIRKSMVDGAIITNLVKQRNFSLEKDVLTAQLRDLPDFMNPETGEFDKQIWNEWVESPDVDWNDIYTRITDSTARQVFLDVVLAPAARVSDTDITKELEKKFTTLKIKYYKVDPPVEPTEEQIKAFYDKELAKTDGKIKYQKPDQFTVDYVAYSLAAPAPQLALDIVKQAREGADFAALADQHSEFKTKNGGEMGGWQRALAADAPHRKPLFDLKTGEVSEPILATDGYFVYKVDEERTAEDGVREVKARQIFIGAKLNDADKAALKARAQALVDKATAIGKLATAVEELNKETPGLELKRTPVFDSTSAEIEGIVRPDLVSFRGTFSNPNMTDKFPLIEAGQHIYVAEVAERKEGPIPPLEEIKEDVKKDALRDLKQQDDYKNQVKEYSDKIKAAGFTNIDEIPAKFPELKGAVGESDEFKVKDFFVKVPATAGGERPFFPSDKVYDVLHGKGPGAFGGPVEGFSPGEAYYVQLIEEKPATEEDKKEFDKEKKSIRDQRINQAKNDLMQDLTQDLREKTATRFLIEWDEYMLGEMLGRGTPQEPAPAPVAPAADGAAAPAAAETAPAADAPAPAADAPAPAAQ
jgi:hypothetical protein